MVRLRHYAVTSTLATIATVVYAAILRQQFYPSVIYLATSKLCCLVLGNFCFMLFLYIIKALKIFFFGELRQIEIEKLYENCWISATEILLSMTIFRDEFNNKFFIYVIILFFIKISHWMVQHRLNWLQIAPQVQLSAHLRLLLLMALLLLIDVTFLSYSLSVILESGPSVLLLFIFEYIVLASTIATMFLKYVL